MSFLIGKPVTRSVQCSWLVKEVYTIETCPRNFIDKFLLYHNSLREVNYSTFRGLFDGFLNTTKKAIGFKSLRLTCLDITQVIEKCEISTNVSKTSTCYLIQSYLLIR